MLCDRRGVAAAPPKINRTRPAAQRPTEGVINRERSQPQREWSESVHSITYDVDDVDDVDGDG